MATTILQGRNGDWDLTRTNSAGKRALSLVRNSVYVAATKLRNRFKMHLGEWQYDVRLGIPYKEVVYRKGTSLGIIKRLFSDVILSLSPVIVRIERLDVVNDPITRKAECVFVATGNDDQTIEGGTNRPFIVGNEYIPAGSNR